MNRMPIVASLLLLGPQSVYQSRKVNDPLTIGGDVKTYAWAPDGERVVYVADQLVDNVYELFSKPSGSASPADRLNGPATTLHRVLWTESPPCLFDPESDLVIFQFHSNQPPIGENDFFSAPRDASQPSVFINPNSTAARVLAKFALSGGRLVYAEEMISGAPGWHIWNCAVDGSLPPLELTVSSSATLIGVEVTPQQDLVLYNDLEAGVYHLRTVPVDGGTPPVAITPALSGIWHTFKITPAGDHVVFVANVGEGDPFHLWSVPVTGGALVQLTPPLSSDRAVDPAFLLTPDGARVVYRADQDTDDVHELYSVPVLGGASTKLSGAMIAAGDVDGSSYPDYTPQFVVGPDGTRVVYRADQASNEVFELFSAPHDGSAPAVRLNAPPVGDVDRSRFLFTLDGLRVVYVANQDTFGSHELYVVPADGTQPPVRLNPPMVVNGGVFPLIDDPYEPFALTLDGQQLVYIADQVVDETYELFSVPLDGSQFATRVNRSLVAGGDVTSFLLGPSGDVLYLADQQHDDVKELYRASTVRAHGVPRQPGTPLGSH